MKAVFRTDASIAMGSGHVMRCLALAARLRREGAEVAFLCRELPGAPFASIEQAGHALYRLPPVDAGELADADQCAAVLAKLGRPDWLIVDHYGLALPWEQRLRPQVNRLMVIDDIANRGHECDLLLDQNFAENADRRYNGLVPERARCLLGPRYALLRETFAEKSLRRARAGRVQRILVFFGGADSTNETRKTIAALVLLACGDIVVDVVIGAMNERYGEIRDSCRALGQFRVYQDADMAALMTAADLAIGAGGATAWERCAAGLPAIAWAIADNQHIVINELARIGALYAPAIDSIRDAEGLARHIYALINNPPLLAAISERAAELCDGRGAERVAAAMRESAISVRRADVDDCWRVYEWRNHPSIRAMSLQTAAIAWDDHQRWFAETLTRADRVLLIGCAGERPIGVVRFDFADAEPAEVSIFVDPTLADHGYGAKLLQAGEEWLAAHGPRVAAVTARVRPDNVASVRLFERAGYRAVYRLYRKDLTA